ncbi:hypothetical protein AB0469_01240 [Streptomyces sp. NPDC093801]|uniref:hypothetical protein n=1 Tax=Streptomyces sp. NPDC093801 TaxID=3155203 RepID=UPI00344B47AD
MAQLIRDTAMQVDEIQQQLLARAETALRSLERITTGRDTVRHTATDGVLQYVGVEIDMLVARRGDGIRLLKLLTNSYADLHTAAQQRTPQATPSHAPAPPPARRRP